VLIVSARLSAEAPLMSEAEAFADGYVTSRGTFQKLFEQHELKAWIDQALETAAVPAGPGVFYAFRDPGERAAFVASPTGGNCGSPPHSFNRPVRDL
jgi:DNA phosphorothioation-associated putative methyltransferase